MHRDATDSSGVCRGPTPAADVGVGRAAARGSADGRRAADGPGGGWRGPAALAVLAALALCCLVPGWGPAAGAGPGALLLRLGLYLSGAAAAWLLGTLIALVCWSPRARLPDFASSWSRLAATVRYPLRVSTGLGWVSCPRPLSLPLPLTCARRPRGVPTPGWGGGPPAAGARGRLGRGGLGHARGFRRCSYSSPHPSVLPLILRHRPGAPRDPGGALMWRCTWGVLEKKKIANPASTGHRRRTQPRGSCLGLPNPWWVGDNFMTGSRREKLG